MSDRSVSRLIFREYDIRGIVGEDLTEEVVELVGRSLGTRLARAGRTDAIVGRDVRESSETFRRALARGLASTGLDVIDVGIVPTPVLYYAIITLGGGGGVMITGSHNPIEYNGLKICDGTSGLYGDEIQSLRETIEAGDFHVAERPGTVRSEDILTRYRADVLGRFPAQRPFKVVVDCGNGVAGPLIPGLLRALGHEVVELYTEPDGRFPNHLPDPEVPEYMVDLVAKVGETGADLGLGFDGDGDRLGVIDEHGVKISADWLLLVYARDLLKRYPGGIVRYDVKCTDFVEEDVVAHGGRPVMGRTGHSILKRDIVASGAIIGGELSGHICFGREYYVIDDPFFCSLRLLQLMGVSGSCSGLFVGFPELFSTAEIKVPVPEVEKFGVVEALTRDFAERQPITVDGARVVFADGWGLVRASNTTANLTVRFEARSRAGLARIRDEFLVKMRRYPFLDLSRVEAAF